MFRILRGFGDCRSQSNEKVAYTVIFDTRALGDQVHGHRNDTAIKEISYAASRVPSLARSRPTAPLHLRSIDITDS